MLRKMMKIEGSPRGIASPEACFLVFFFLSGACSIAYEIIWLRLAFAAFGVITPVLSIVVSVFMLGLALGSWAGGHVSERLAATSTSALMLLYGISELCIGLGAIAVPVLFRVAEHRLLHFGQMASPWYLAASAFAITFSVLPWCILMGATYPLAMGYLSGSRGIAHSTFSYLYAANVFGAMAGALATPFVLVEMLGFTKTSYLASSVNLAVALAALSVGAASRRPPGKMVVAPPPMAATRAEPASLEPGAGVFVVLFVTGFTSMAMEVIWTRGFTPITGTTVYAVALLLVTYLAGTADGALRYRKALAAGRVKPLRDVALFLSVTAFLPLLLNDPRLKPNVVNVIAGVFPFCAGLGYLLPMLIDRHSQGVPKRAAVAYAANILGCVMGPLFAGYLLLPVLGVKWSMLLLAAPYTILVAYVSRARGSDGVSRRVGPALAAGLLLVAPASLTVEDGMSREGQIVRRDYAATVSSAGEGLNKVLIVNGVGITTLTPITKVMAHLPLAVFAGKPESVLVICFGMGTTFRSARSWPVRVTAVELVPSVRDAFGFYFSDAATVLDPIRGNVIIDDGRRFMTRTDSTFDVITVDPPPPVESAGSSLLYSEEFYGLVRKRLSRGGILQQWLPGGDDASIGAVASAIRRSFPHVKVYGSLEGWGFHFLASGVPLSIPGPDGLAGRMPPAARRDLVEWSPALTIEGAMAAVLRDEHPLNSLVSRGNGFTLTDDRPVNEYFVLRRLAEAIRGASRTAR